MGATTAGAIYERLQFGMTDEGTKVLDGSAYERDGVGCAGTKGFVGGFAACGKARRSIAGTVRKIPSVKRGYSTTILQ
jgi:hypothetical protein